MIKAPISLQDLRRRIYVKAKADRFGGFRPGNLQGFGWRRWSRYGLYDTLRLLGSCRVQHPLPKVAPAR